MPAIVRAIASRGIEASALDDVSELSRAIDRGARRGDAILIMSNGSFGGLIPMLIAALETRSDAALS